jgi:hypothetical protein
VQFLFIIHVGPVTGCHLPRFSGFKKLPVLQIPHFSQSLTVQALKPYAGYLFLLRADPSHVKLVVPYQAAAACWTRARCRHCPHPFDRRRGGKASILSAARKLEVLLETLCFQSILSLLDNSSSAQYLPTSGLEALIFVSHTLVQGHSQRQMQPRLVIHYTSLSYSLAPLALVPTPGPMERHSWSFHILYSV